MPGIFFSEKEKFSDFQTKKFNPQNLCEVFTHAVKFYNYKLLKVLLYKSSKFFKSVVDTSYKYLLEHFLKFSLI